tara:strand:- start:1067 stop:1768 length:702 start_codon:yes stop_codon:yes gene_type:complete
MNKQVLIFGASGGLGQELMNIFLSNNHKIIATTSKNTNIFKLRKKFKEFNKKKIEWNLCDLKKENQIIKIINKYFKKNTCPEIVIICSGVFKYNILKKLDYRNLIDDFKINLFSNIIINKQILNKKIKNKKVTIVNIGSSSSYYGFKNTISYCASKHGLLGAVKAINDECKKNKIFNTCVSMGSMKTKMGKKVRNQEYRNFIDPQKIAKYIFDITANNMEAYVEEIFFKRSKL